MIYRRAEFVQEDTEDEDFPIKQVDRLESLDGDEKKFIGRANLNMQTPVGVQQIPISFEIDAGDIEDAFDKYAAAARPKINEVRERIQQRIQQMQQQAQQQQGNIVTPDQSQMAGDIVSLDDLRGQE